MDILRNIPFPEIPYVDAYTFDYYYAPINRPNIYLTVVEPSMRIP